MVRRPSLFALFNLWSGGFRKPLGASLLSLALIGGCATAFVTAVTQTTMAYLSVAAVGLGVVSARPRQIRRLRMAQNGTIWRDYDNGKTLIAHADGSWTVVPSRQSGLQPV